MKLFEIRLLEEAVLLEEKINKLESFFETDMFAKISETQQSLLDDQFEAMVDYLDCLNARLKDLGIER